MSSNAHNPADEYLHTPEDTTHWQESVFFAWRDARTGISGVHRLALETQRGTSNTYCGLMLDDGTSYRQRVLDGALDHGGAGATRCEVAPQHVLLGPSPTLVVHDTDAEVDAELTFTNFEELSEGLQGGDGGYQASLLASHHVEGLCNVRGSVRIDGRELTVDGYGFRDHSWGPRDWEAILSHRVCIGTTGPDLAWSALVMHVAGRPLMTQGYVSRGGTEIPATSVDLICHLEPDGLTHRGGRCVMELADGTSFTIDTETITGTMYEHRAIFSMEAISRVWINGEHQPGAFCLSEMSNNPRSGRNTPELAIRGDLGTGLTRPQIPVGSTG